MGSVRRRRAADFIVEASENPRCAFLYATGELVKAATRADIPTYARCQAKAELLLRYCLRPNGVREVEDVLVGWLGAPVLEMLRRVCARAEGNPARVEDEVESVLRTQLQAGRIDEREKMALRAALLPFLKADGVIPVFRRNEGTGYLLPFHFVPRMGEPTVRDFASARIAEWSACLAALPDVTEDVLVDFPQADDAPFVGDSLMLPLLMAWWRHQNELPSYRPLRFLATGAFRGGRLGEVATEEKSRKVSADVEGGMLIRPGEGGGRGEIPVALTPEEVRERVRIWAEEESVCEADYAMRRFEYFERQVRQVNAAGWASLNRRLDNVVAGLSKSVYADSWIHLNMLRSAARCHAGRTEDAAEINGEVRAYVERLRRPKYEPLLLRLEIEDLVILEDREDFDRIFRLVPGLERRLEDFAARAGENVVVQDLRMRFYGTMGQVLAYAALDGRPEGSAERACGQFRRAYEAAAWLKDEALERDAVERCTRLGDMAQDANYCLLGAALFAPDEMEDCLETAEEIAHALRGTCFGADGQSMARKNDGFRQRAHALGGYRMLLNGAPPDVIPDYGDLARHGYFWIAATTGKYLGALHAARGETGPAAEYFALADEKMELGRREEGDGDVLRIIHMTVCAEAFRSLRRNRESAALAEKMRGKARAFFDLPGSGDWRKDAWRLWLERPDDMPFPGLSYWY